MDADPQTTADALSDLLAALCAMLCTEGPDVGGGHVSVNGVRIQAVRQAYVKYMEKTP